jgi:hypothetical protein
MQCTEESRGDWLNPLGKIVLIKRKREGEVQVKVK